MKNVQLHPLAVLLRQDPAVPRVPEIGVEVVLVQDLDQVVDLVLLEVDKHSKNRFVCR